MKHDGSWSSRLTYDAAVIGLCIATFTICAVIASDGKVQGAELWLFHRINRWPDWLEPPLTLFQFLGVLVTPLVFAAIAFVLKRWRLGTALVLVVPLKLLIERVPKALVERQRPGTSVSDAILRGNVPDHGLSFVSGHAMIAFSVAGLLFFALPRRWDIVTLVIAILVAVARVYLGAHNPLDVIGGAAVGLLLSAVLDLVFNLGHDVQASEPRPPPADARQDSPADQAS